MNIIISHTSMEPIYEQIVRQIRAKIIDGSLKEKEPLPSVRTLSRELRISALTVKKAYDFLDEEGLIVTVHGKGSFVAEANRNLLREERQKWKQTWNVRSEREGQEGSQMRSSGKCLPVFWKIRRSESEK